MILTYENDLHHVEKINQVLQLLTEGVSNRSSLEDHDDDWKYDPQIRGCLLELHRLTEEMMQSEGMGRFTTLGDASE